METEWAVALLFLIHYQGALEMDSETHKNHPDWEEIKCATCSQVAQGDPYQLKDWITRHEAYMKHQVIRK